MKKHVPNNTYCPRCGHTYMVAGDDNSPATVEQIREAKMACPCCDVATLRHIYDEEGS